MNIAHILPASVTFPLDVPNGRYTWVLQLAMRQVKHGHDVTIYCNRASRLAGIRFIGIDSLTNDKKINNTKTFRLALSNHHDIYHSHFDDLHYELALETTSQIVFTQHWWPHESTIELARTHSANNNVWAVPPTNYMYKFDLRSGIPSKGYIYHGIDLGSFHALNRQKSDRLLFVGRISPEKNLEIAITAAKQSGLGLDIIGKLTEKKQDYWNSIKHLIDGDQIQYLGTKKRDEIIEYYTTARALIFPSDIHEAFGLVAIESQACGTPVIMNKGGSRSELVDAGKTGFLCETDEDFLSAVKAVDTLSSVDCINFAKKFNIETMEKQYEELYGSLI